MDARLPSLATRARVLWIRIADLEVLTMATRHDNLSGEELNRQRALDRSWEAANRLLSEEEFRAYLDASIERVRSSEADAVTGDEFLAQTKPDT